MASDLVFILATIVAILTLTLANLVAPEYAKENAIIEMAQNYILLVSALMTTFYAYKSNNPERSMWLVAVTILLLALGRELSWGAALAPLLYPETYTSVPASRTLWFKNYLVIFLGIILAAAIINAVKHRILQIATRMKSDHKLPLKEVFAIIICALIMTAAEGNMGLSLPIQTDNLFVVEELIETSAYLYMLSFIFRVRSLTQNT